MAGERKEGPDWLAGGDNIIRPRLESDDTGGFRRRHAGRVRQTAGVANLTMCSMAAIVLALLAAADRRYRAVGQHVLREIGGNRIDSVRKPDAHAGQHIECKHDRVAKPSWQERP